MDIQSIIDEIRNLCFSCGASVGDSPHSELITNLGYLLRTRNYRVQHDYPLSYMHRTLKTGKVQRRWGYIDLFADDGNHKIVIEYDSHRSLEYNSIEKLLQSNADAPIGIIGNGRLSPNIERILEVMESSGIMNKKVLLVSMSEKDSEEIFW